MSHRYANAALVIFSGVVMAALIYVFYSSPLRQRIENKLFDLRTRLSPTITRIDDVALVTIDEQTIAAYEGRSAEPAKDLSYEALISILRVAITSQARDIVLFLPPQVFSYQDPGLAELADVAAADPRVMLVVFDDAAGGSAPMSLPVSIQAIADRVFKGDVVRKFRRSVVRDFVINSRGERTYAATALARRHAHAQLEKILDRERSNDEISLKLNYVDLNLLPRIPAEDLQENLSSLKARTAIIGYVTFRNWSLQTAEATLVNTPWQIEGGEVDEGEPLISIHALAFMNILQNTWLKPLPIFANVFQSFFLSGLSLGIWHLSAGFATLLFVGGWSVVLIFHALLFAFANRYLALADALLFSSIAMVAGSIWKLRQEGMLRAAYEARAASDAELALIQERFLTRFACELSSINKSIKYGIERLPFASHPKDGVKTAYGKIRSSSDELGDYLTGIEQFALLQGKYLKKPQPSSTKLAAVVHSVTRQFDAKREEAGIQLDFASFSDCTVWGDKTLLTQIIYNLISNAIKYSPPHSTVSISTSKRGRDVILSVKDEGPGIAPEYQERIFEKFYRIKNDDVFKIKGHGLGLFLSRYFAATIDARLTVDSRPNQGTSFHLRLKTVRS